MGTALSDRPIPPARMRRIFPPESFAHCHAFGSSPIRHYRSFLPWRCTLLAFGTTATSTRRRRKHSTQRFRANLEQTVIFRSLFVASASVPPMTLLTFLGAQQHQVHQLGSCWRQLCFSSVRHLPHSIPAILWLIRYPTFMAATRSSATILGICIKCSRSPTALTCTSRILSS
jgi:hypothetical protein